jgi:DNA-binding transcriptional ArsR family regulator
VAVLVSAVTVAVPRTVMAGMLAVEVVVGAHASHHDATGGGTIYAKVRRYRYKEYRAAMSKAGARKDPPAHSDSLSDEQVQAAVVSFTLLAEPTRVRMLWALRDDQLDVGSLAAVAGCRPTVASQHLSKLRFAGLVEATREGRRMVYRLRGGHVRALLTEALFQADHQVSGHPVHE